MKDKIETYKLKITFVTPILGNQGSKTIATDFISKKSGIDFTEEELATLPEMLERQTLVFNKDDDKVVVFGYQLKGALKNAATALNGQAGNGVKALHSKVEKHVFVSPTGYIPLFLPATNGNSPKQATNSDITYIEHAARVKTAQGDRVTVLRSECLPTNCYFECGLIVYPGDIKQDVLTDLLNYLFDIGMGGWRGRGLWSYRIFSYSRGIRVTLPDVEHDDSELFTCPICGGPILIRDAETAIGITVKKKVGNNFLLVTQWYHKDCIQKSPPTEQ